MKRVLPIIGLIFAVVLAAMLAIYWLSYLNTAQELLVPRGVSFNKQKIGGIKLSEAEVLISATANEQRARIVEVSAADAKVPSDLDEFEASEFLKYNDAEIISEIKKIRSNLDFFARLKHDLLGREIKRDYSLKAELDEGALEAYTQSLADALNRSAQEKKLEINNSGLVSTEGKEGFKLDIRDTKTQIKRALGVGTDESVEGVSKLILQGSLLKPGKLESELAEGQFIFVNLKEYEVKLYEDGEVIRTYPCCIGAPGFDTPKGDFEVTLKRRNPIWGNPGSSWSKDMPPTMGPSADSPLGLRALNINAPGIRLHGTSNRNSLGTASSHGCVRLANDDIVELFDLVEVGTPVYIR